MGLNVSKPVNIQKAQNKDAFDCGNEALNTWLKQFALQNDAADSAKTFVVIEKNEDRIVAFYSLAAGSVGHEDAADRIKKGLPRNPIPVMLLTRLAVDVKFQGKGLGKGLLKDAMLKTLKASEYAGIRAILVHAKDEKVAEFYGKYGFEPSLVNPLMMMLLLKDARKSVKE